MTVERVLAVRLVGRHMLPAEQPEDPQDGDYKDGYAKGLNDAFTMSQPAGTNGHTPTFYDEATALYIVCSNPFYQHTQWELGYAAGFDAGALEVDARKKAATAS